MHGRKTKIMKSAIKVYTLCKWILYVYS